MSKAFRSHIDEARSPSDIRYIVRNCGPMIHDPGFVNYLKCKITALMNPSKSYEFESYSDIIDAIDFLIETRSRLAPRNVFPKSYDHVKNKPIPKPQNVQIARNCESEFIVDLDMTKHRKLLFQIEKELILRAYKQCNFNTAYTAMVCGVSERTVRNKLNSYSNS